MFSAQQQQQTEYSDQGKSIKMSHRSRRSDDRDRDRERDRSYKYDKYEHRSYHRDYDDYDDSRDHHSRRSRHRSRSRSSSRSYSKHHRSRSRSSGRSHSRHLNEYHHRSHHRSKDSPDSKSRRDSRDYHQSKHGTATDSRVDKKSKYETKNEINENYGPSSISTELQNNKNYNAGTNEEPKRDSTAPIEEDSELEAEKQRVQRETMERLQKHFEKEGKAYPPARPQASHPIFANDGSFLEIFKKTIQQQQTSSSTLSPPTTAVVMAAAKEPLVKSTIAATTAATTTNPVIPILPVKRRGAKILKTGIVQKQRVVEESEEPQSTDSWSSYLKEVKRYKTVTCSDDNITRSLVK